jgi:ribonuclease D
MPQTTTHTAPRSIHLHQGDLPDHISFTGSVAIDTETLGLNPLRDKLCLVQLSQGDGVCHMVKFDVQKPYNSPNLRKLLGDPTITKIFHFARFDVATLSHHLQVTVAPIYCTKIASKLTRTYTARHSLKDLCHALLSISLDKQCQLSDWGDQTLSEEQLAYAAHDVLYLHKLKDALDALLIRSNRVALANECFAFLPTCANLDLQGWEVGNLFAHT